MRKQGIPPYISWNCVYVLYIQIGKGLAFQLFKFNVVRDPGKTALEKLKLQSVNVNYATSSDPIKHGELEKKRGNVTSHQGINETML